MLAMEHMMRRQICMPAHLMDDGQHGANNPGRTLFDDFAAVAQRTGTYTARDYVAILQHLLRLWDVEHLRGLSPEVCSMWWLFHSERASCREVVHRFHHQAEAAQEYVCLLPERLLRLAERAEARATKGPRDRAVFAWVHNRGVRL